MSRDSNKKPSFFGLVSLKDERLSQRITLTFGFMAFIPVLILTLALSTLVFPYMEEGQKTLLIIYITGAVLSIFVGYVVLKYTVGSIMHLVAHARKIAESQLGEKFDSNSDEIGELAKTFNRITRELQDKVEELESAQKLVKQLLQRIGTALNSNEGLDNLFGLILENASHALGADAGSIVLRDFETGKHAMIAHWMRDAGAFEALSECDSEMTARVLKEGEPLRGHEFASAIGLKSKASTKGAVLCVPMQCQGKNMGVISIFHSTASSFSADDELLLGNIASQLAVAAENNRLNLDVERTYIDTITALALAVEAKDPYSAGHSKRVGYYAEQIGRVMGCDAETLHLLQEGGVLHDVGKIGIKDEILLKPEPLNSEETAIMRQHPVIGEAILKPLRSMRLVAEMVRHHHERFDGEGYPDKLKGEEIPFAARILLVADAYDSMITDRPYRKRLSNEIAKAELQKGAGTHFDGKVVEAAIRMIDSGATKAFISDYKGSGNQFSPFKHSLADKMLDARKRMRHQSFTAFDNERD